MYHINNRKDVIRLGKCMHYDSIRVQHVGEDEDNKPFIVYMINYLINNSIVTSKLYVYGIGNDAPFPLFTKYIQRTPMLRTLKLANNISSLESIKAFFVSLYGNKTLWELIVHVAADDRDGNKIYITDLVNKTDLHYISSYDLSNEPCSQREMLKRSIKHKRKDYFTWNYSTVHERLLVDDTLSYFEEFKVDFIEEIGISLNLKEDAVKILSLLMKLKNPLKKVSLQMHLEDYDLEWVLDFLSNIEGLQELSIQLSKFSAEGTKRLIEGVICSPSNCTISYFDFHYRVLNENDLITECLELINHTTIVRLPFRFPGAAEALCVPLDQRQLMIMSNTKSAAKR